MPQYLHAIKISIEDVAVVDGGAQAQRQLQVVHLRVYQQRVADLNLAVREGRVVVDCDLKNKNGILYLCRKFLG